jgi:peptide/nickel transport system substrate-binding protein
MRPDGIDLNDDGIRDKIIDSDTVELKFTILTNEDNSMRKDVAELIAQQLRQVGIAVQSMTVPWEEFETILLDGDFDAVLTGYYLDMFRIFNSCFIPRL